MRSTEPSARTTMYAAISATSMPRVIRTRTSSVPAIVMVDPSRSVASRSRIRGISYCRKSAVDGVPVAERSEGQQLVEVFEEPLGDPDGSARRHSVEAERSSSASCRPRASTRARNSEGRSSRLRTMRSSNAAARSSGVIWSSSCAVTILGVVATTKGYPERSRLTARFSCTGVLVPCAVISHARSVRVPVNGLRPITAVLAVAIRNSWRSLPPPVRLGARGTTTTSPLRSACCDFGIYKHATKVRSWQLIEP
jgi:hypothetical protein